MGMSCGLGVRGTSITVYWGPPRGVLPGPSGLAWCKSSSRWRESCRSSKRWRIGIRCLRLWCSLESPGIAKMAVRLRWYLRRSIVACSSLGFGGGGELHAGLWFVWWGHNGVCNARGDAQRHFNQSSRFPRETFALWRGMEAASCRSCGMTSVSGSRTSEYRLSSRWIVRLYWESWYYCLLGNVRHLVPGYARPVGLGSGCEDFGEETKM